MPFCYQSTGVETRFTNGFDPDPRSRDLFAFHRPDTLASWLQTSPPVVSGSFRDGQEGYSRPRRLPLRFEDLKTLAETLQAPPRLWTESQLWQAYAALDKRRVKGASQRRILTDLVSLVRYAMHQENELVPFPERVAANFKAWLGQQEAAGRSFTPEQRK